MRNSAHLALYRAQGGIMTARDHAVSFLVSTDARFSIRRIGKAIFEAAESDKEIATMLDAIQQKLGDGRPIIGEKHSDIYDRIKVPSAIPDIPTAPEWLRPLVATGYLKAKTAITPSKASQIINNPKESLAKVQKLADQLEPEFFGELLVETVMAAREDPGFARVLREAGNEFRSLVEYLYSLSTVGAPNASVAGGSSGGSCRACRTSGGTTRCEPMSCWVIVVVIVVIIVTK